MTRKPVLHKICDMDRNAAQQAAQAFQSHYYAQKERADSLERQLLELKYQEGSRDGMVRVASAAIKALHLDHGETSPNDVRDAIERLVANTAKLPKTADGVVVVPGMTFYTVSPAGHLTKESCRFGDSRFGPICPELCYSTSELAEASLKEETKPEDE